MRCTKVNNQMNTFFHRCRNVIRLNVASHEDLDKLPLPSLITSYLKLEDEVEDTKGLRPRPVSPKSVSPAALTHYLGLCECSHTNPPCSQIEITIERGNSPLRTNTSTLTPTPIVVTTNTSSSSSSSSTRITRSMNQNKKRSMPYQNHTKTLSGFKRTKIPMPDL